MLRLIGFVAVLCLAFYAGMQYQKSRTAQQIVAEKIQQQKNRLVEKLK